MFKHDTKHRQFVQQTFKIIEAGNLCEVAAAFTFGREDLLPDVFQRIVDELNTQAGGRLEEFKYYLERHIGLDGDEHGPMATAISLSRQHQSHPDLFRSIIINPRDRSLCLNKTPGIKSAVIDAFHGKMLRKNCFYFNRRQFWGFSSYEQLRCKDSNQTTLQQKLW